MASPLSPRAEASRRWKEHDRPTRGCRIRIPNPYWGGVHIIKSSNSTTPPHDNVVQHARWGRRALRVGGAGGGDRGRGRGKGVFRADDEQEAIPNEVHGGAEGEDAEVCRESWMEDSKARGECGAAILSRDWSEEKSS